MSFPSLILKLGEPPFIKSTLDNAAPSILLGQLLEGRVIAFVIQAKTSASKDANSVILAWTKQPTANEKTLIDNTTQKLVESKFIKLPSINERLKVFRDTRVGWNAHAVLTLLDCGWSRNKPLSHAVNRVTVPANFGKVRYLAVFLPQETHSSSSQQTDRTQLNYTISDRSMESYEARLTEQTNLINLKLKRLNEKFDTRVGQFQSVQTALDGTLLELSTLNKLLRDIVERDGSGDDDMETTNRKIQELHRKVEETWSMFQEDGKSRERRTTAILDEKLDRIQKELLDELTTLKEAFEAHTPTILPPPPLPPPLSPPLPPLLIPPPVAPSQSKTSNPSPEDSRGALLDAIKKGTKLKSADNKTVERTLPTEDLTTQLSQVIKNSLSTRRWQSREDADIGAGHAMAAVWIGTLLEN